MSATEEEGDDEDDDDDDIDIDTPAGEPDDDEIAAILSGAAAATLKPKKGPRTLAERRARGVEGMQEAQCGQNCTCESMSMNDLKKTMAGGGPELHSLAIMMRKYEYCNFLVILTFPLHLPYRKNSQVQQGQASRAAQGPDAGGSSHQGS